MLSNLHEAMGLVRSRSGLLDSKASNYPDGDRSQDLSANKAHTASGVSPQTLHAGVLDLLVSYRPEAPRLS